MKNCPATYIPLITTGKPAERKVHTEQWWKGADDLPQPQGSFQNTHTVMKYTTRNSAITVDLRCNM